jgi:hypothetical protein
MLGGGNYFVVAVNPQVRPFAAVWSLPWDQHGTQNFLSFTSRSNFIMASRVSRFLRPADDLNTANSACILSVSANIISQFMSHDWELLTSLHGKSIVIRIFLSKLLKIWPEQCGWEWWGYIQYMPYLTSWRHWVRWSFVNVRMTFGSFRRARDYSDYRLDRMKGAAIADPETGSSPGNLLHLSYCNGFWELRDL